MSTGQEWNIVVTVHEEGFKPAKRVLREAGTIGPTDYHDVLVMKVEDVRAFTVWLAKRVAEEPGLLNFISRAVPATHVFDFHSAEEFEGKAREAVLGFMPEVAAKSFHVRMHRRGLGDRSRRRTRSGAWERRCSRRSRRPAHRPPSRSTIRTRSW